MKTIFKTLVILLALFTVSCTAINTFEGYAFPQAVRVVTPFGSGSGVIIEEGVLTAAHVIDNIGSEKYYVVTKTASFSGDRYLYRGDKGPNDRVVLKVETKIPPAKVYCGPLKTGERVIHVGYPGTGGSGVIRSITYGRISVVNTEEQGDYSNMVGADLGADAGSSGGPVFNMKGEVVGIVVAVGRGHYGSLWTTLIARPPPEVCPALSQGLPVISNEVP
jgi:S1-C subfamily serine protease